MELHSKVKDWLPTIEVKSWKDLKGLFTYKQIVNNVSYIIFAFMLCISYVANSNKANNILREQSKKLETLKEVNWRYKDLQSRLMYQTSENQIKERAAQVGLKPLEKPAFEIVK